MNKKSEGRGAVQSYLRYLLTRHIAYFFVCIFMVMGIVALVVYGVQFIQSQDKKLQQVRSDIKTLQERKRALDLVASVPTQQLASDLVLISALIPEGEDYFTIMAALEELSVQTGFLIESYTINLDKSTSTKLSINVQGVGSSEAFLKFLDTYQVGGGRLITAEKIQLDSLNTTGITLALNFYNQKTPEGTATFGKKNVESSLSLLNKIRDKVHVRLREEADAPVATSSASPVTTVLDEYPTKTNPF